MLTLPTAAELHLAQVSRRITVAGVIFKNDGTEVRCTQHDDDLTITDGPLAGFYESTSTVTASDIKSSTDLSVDNLEVSGFISTDFQITGFSAADIEAGLFDNAPFTTFICQWDAPNDWQKIMRSGFLGEISRTAEGAFQAEWRGLMQACQQQLGATYGDACDVKDFGDARCGLIANVQTAVVTGVTSPRRFDVSIAGTIRNPGFFNLGKAAFTSGANRGFLRQIKNDTNIDTIGQLSVFEPFPNAIQVGDTLTVREGCDRLFTTCQAKANVDNFRGHGHWIPGIPSIIRAP